MSGFGCSDGRSKSHAKPPIELKTRFKNRIFQRILFELVLIAMRVHLFPSRTQKLSSSAPTIVAGRLAVKIGNANMEGLCTSCAEVFSLCDLAAKRLAADAFLSFEFREVRAWRMLCVCMKRNIEF